MARFKLVPYIIKVKKVGSRDYLNMTQIPSPVQIKDFLGLFNDFCDRCGSEVYKNSSEKKTLYIENLAKLKKRAIHGIIKSGEYGFETNFYDTNQKRHIRGARLEHHSEELPFFFLFHSPFLEPFERLSSPLSVPER